MKDNKGFSIVEMVIVLAIMAVLGSAIFYSYTLIVGQYARECANNLSTALEKEKNYALTRSASVDCYMELVKDGNNYYARYFVPQNAIETGNDSKGDGDDWILAEELKIGKSRVGLTCTLEGGGAILIGDGKSAKFVYNRISGAMKGVQEGSGAEPAEVGGLKRGKLELNDDGSLKDSKKCSKITIVEGRTYEIEIYSGTGKHNLSRVG